MARGETAIGKIKKGIHYSWKTVWNANKIVLILFFLIDMVQAFCPLMQVYILNLLIDVVMERDLHRSLVLSLIWISILLLGNFLQAFGNYIRGRINAMSNRYAYVDGCGRWQAHVHITFPQMKSAFAFLTIMGWINGMQRFTDVYTLGGMTGSPARSLHTIVGFIYERGFGNYEFGVASAASCILFVIILLFTLLNMKLTGGDES